MDESKHLEEIRTWEHPPWHGIVQIEEKVTLIFLENQKGLFQHLTTRFRMPVKRQMIFGPCQETSYTAITLNPESGFTRREKNHSLFHWCTFDVTRTTHTNLDVKQAKRIDDYWNIDGSRDLSDSCTGFTQFTLLEENLQTGKCGPGGDWRENSSHPGQITYGQNSGRKWKECQAEGEAKVVTWKTSTR